MAVEPNPSIDWEVEAWDRGWRSGYDRGYGDGLDYAIDEELSGAGINGPAWVSIGIATLCIVVLCIVVGQYAGLRGQVSTACHATMNTLSESTAWLPACQTVLDH